MASMQRKRSQRGITMYLGVLGLVMIVPMVGLVIDVGILYSAKSRLQAAVDGASLAAARALNLGQTTDAQKSTAKQNAVNWFYANFPSGNWSTMNTQMDTSDAHVLVQDDPNNSNLRDVNVTASTTVPTWFMRWFNLNSTTIYAQGFASRRDVVAMMVLDRSGSMCKGGSNPCTGASSTPCGSMVTAAKNFTGQFAENRDYIGLVSFSDNTYIHSAPTQTFQSTLGYTNDSGSASGDIDNISCGGGTSTAEAMSMAYQLLYETNLPGALNVILLETDGLPNTLAMNFYDSTNSVAGLTNSSGCKDNNNKTKSGGGFNNAASIPHWTPGLLLNASPFGTTHPYFGNIPAGMVGTVSSEDPGGGGHFWNMINYWTTYGQSESAGNSTYPFNSVTSSSSPSILTTTNSPASNGCNFLSSGYYTTNPNDIAWWPSTDIMGNHLNPSAYSYLSVTTDAQGHVTQSGSSPGNWSNYHNAVMNATNDSAYQARTNGTLPATIFAIGLGGNSASGPPDPVLLQRMANDPNADEFNNPSTYVSCASATNCATFSSQPQGTFIYSPTATNLGAAFLRISSQILRLSH